MDCDEDVSFSQCDIKQNKSHLYEAAILDDQGKFDSRLFYIVITNIFPVKLNSLNRLFHLTLLSMGIL